MLMKYQQNKIYHQKPVQNKVVMGSLKVQPTAQKTMKAVSKTCGCGKAKYKN
jgi:hypothetical protein